MTWRWLAKGVVACCVAGVVTYSIFEEWWHDRERTR